MQRYFAFRFGAELLNGSALKSSSRKFDECSWKILFSVRVGETAHCSEIAKSNSCFHSSACNQLLILVLGLSAPRTSPCALHH